MDSANVHDTVTALWDGPVLTSLSDLVAIPAVSQEFDPDWANTGHLAAAVEHVRTWIAQRDLPGARLEVLALPGRSPVLVVEVPATAGADAAGTVLLYGHLDKQPPVGGWAQGLDPWQPVVRDGRLYGRGAADDGYAGYASVAAIEAVRAAGGGHARCVLVLETGEESGSPDLPDYLDLLRERLGPVSLVVCLDSGSNDYQRVWLTTSLRGLVQVRLTVRVLSQGQHSGNASGVVTSSFRVLRQLLDRLEDSATGVVRLPELSVEVPADRLTEIREGVAAAPGVLPGSLPLLPGVRPADPDEVELTLNNTWRPTLSVTGADGLPAPQDAGNVLRPYTTLCLSFRLPPTADSTAAAAAVRAALTTDVPDGAVVELSGEEDANGWNAPDLAPWLKSALDTAGQEVFGQPWRTMGMGGSIPFLGLLQQRYPQAQFVVTGVLGPGSNAHVPDESLHLSYAAKLTETIALVLDAHSRTA
jgi:acetylornithine deacetylase/succinyl-diaminopimelate desuccinylase-like protein